MNNSSKNKGKAWERFWKVFGSVRFALLLFLILSLISILGTFIPQGADPAFYQDRYGERAHRLLSGLDLIDLFHSWWFIVLLSLFSLNLIICSLRRLPSLARVFDPPTIDIDFAKESCITQKRSWIIPPGDPLPDMMGVLKRKGYRIQTEEGNPPARIVASKGRWSRVGPHLVHFSILMILFGATLGALFGYRGYVNIPEGQAVDFFNLQGGRGIRNLGFSLRCDDFEATYYPGTHRPKDYKSQITVIDQGREAMKRTILVNSPLAYKGINFYQSSFGNTGGVKSLTFSLENPSRGISLQFTAPLEKPQLLEGTNYSVKVLHFLPDFALDEGFKAFSRSGDLNNPAAEVEIRERGRTLLKTWVFAKFREFHRPIQKEDIRISIIGYEVPQYTGLQVGYDPGVNWVWTGFALLICGLSLSFLMSEKYIWVHLIRGKGEWEVRLMGSSRREKEPFEREFISLCGILEKEGWRPCQ